MELTSFLFNSYLELDRGMRMRARCAAWQLWVSEKFSLLLSVNSRTICVRNTPRTRLGVGTTSEGVIDRSSARPLAGISLRSVSSWGTSVYEGSAGTAVFSSTSRSGWFPSRSNRLCVPHFQNPNRGTTCHINKRLKNRVIYSGADRRILTGGPVRKK